MTKMFSSEWKDIKKLSLQLIVEEMWLKLKNCSWIARDLAGYFLWTLVPASYQSFSFRRNSESHSTISNWARWELKIIQSWIPNHMTTAINSFFIVIPSSEHLLLFSKIVWLHHFYCLNIIAACMSVRCYLCASILNLNLYHRNLEAWYLTNVIWIWYAFKFFRDFLACVKCNLISCFTSCYCLQKLFFSVIFSYHNSYCEISTTIAEKNNLGLTRFITFFLNLITEIKEMLIALSSSNYMSVWFWLNILNSSRHSVVFIRLFG